MFIIKIKENYKRLYEGLNGLEKYLILPEPTENSEPSWFGFPITLKKNTIYDRNSLVKFLEERKIGTRLLIAGTILKQSLFTENEISSRVVGDLINTDVIMNSTFWIGVWPGIDDEQINYIIKMFNGFFMM
jgi:CDP-6-deoxy-D-xylo-4-hexulose-3-dehydrase